MAPAITNRGERILRESKIYDLRSSGSQVYVGSLLVWRVVGGSLCPGDIVRSSLASGCGERREWEALRFGGKVYFSPATDRPSDSILSETKGTEPTRGSEEGESTV